MTQDAVTHRGDSPFGRFARTRAVPYVAASLAAALTVGAVTAAGGGPAGAATAPKAQAVARLLDGTVGGMALGKLVDVAESRKIVPTEINRKNLADNSLSPTVLGMINLPLSGALQFPGAPALTVGAGQQITRASSNGSSTALAGAVANSGGASFGGDPSDAGQAFAKVDLTSSALSALGGSSTLPALPTLPGVPPTAGTGSLPALGGLTVDVGAVYGNASIAKGGSSPHAQTGIAGLDLQLASPLLRGILKQLSALQIKAP